MPPETSWTDPSLEMLFAFGLTGLPGSTTAGPSLPNQAPQASITFLRSASDAGAAPPPVYTSRKFAIRRLLVQLFIGQDARAAKRRRTNTGEIDKNRRCEAETSRLGAHPADQLLHLDLVEPPHDPSTAEPEHRETLAVEVLPLLPGGPAAVDRPIFEGDAHLVEEVGHRDRVARAVGAVENGIRGAAHLSIHLVDATLPLGITQIDCSDRRHKEHH